MESHRDRDYPDKLTDTQWWASLERKAEQMMSDGSSSITGGKPNEPELDEWKHGDITCIQRPNDEHGILRISVGGDHPIRKGINYCVFRGDPTQCAYLLEKAARALREH